MGSSFVDKLTESEAPLVYGLRQTDKSGSVSYYFISIDPLKERAFLRSLEGSSVFMIEDYGTLLRREDETSLSPELIHELEEQYNVKFVQLPQN